ncbi:Nucleoporin POM33 [Penicillium alfredii]|uniref:Nucleoporin POM33 n=1 Tax=Penicillium alfredii TaxID=1506179 RepID=A0A9W9FRJ3_9EURO|nr:Nucleoporin POM33 [Penicillium alfredii]KAJ5105068.1 Nucleoporin POM33 [Penicillium alfredii]
MAPPPPATLPLAERLKALAQTLQFAWFVGHLTLLISVLRYTLSFIFFNYYSSSAKIAYRLAFISAAVTYGIVVYKGHFARGVQGNVPTIVTKLISDENVQYLGMALVWLYSRQLLLALLPFSVYSVFHVATYSRMYLIPTLQPPSQGAPGPASPTSPSSKPAGKQSPLAETIGRFIKQYYDASMGVVATLEILLLFRLVLSAITFSKGSWVLLVVYLAFFRARYAQSSFVQQAVRQGWETFKGVVRQGYEATDVGRYLSGAVAAKKPQ